MIVSAAASHGGPPRLHGLHAVVDDGRAPDHPAPAQDLAPGGRMVAEKLMSPLSLMSSPGEEKKEKGGALRSPRSLHSFPCSQTREGSPAGHEMPLKSALILSSRR